MHGFRLLICVVFYTYPTILLAQHTPAILQQVRFHSDNVFLTQKINQSSQDPYSTAVDTVQMLMDEMGYHHPVLNVPLSRSFMQLDKGNPVCVLNKVKSPERVKKYLFSSPLSYFQTQRLYQLASVKPLGEHLLDERGQVISVSDVLDEYTRSAIILPENYSFGEVLDSDIAQINSKQIIPMSNSAYYQRFMTLFEKQRVDFALIFPASMYINFGDSEPYETRSYGIAQTPDFVTGHVICADTEVGQQTIALIDQALASLYQSERFVDAHVAYLPPSAHTEIRDVILEHITAQ
ncbi:hypothetical protein [Alteromonas oceanisediminis]|uniref:hypothetical protein n=1 Tax=Alteromonas oceanisediminis TaxID=2836180 RepID=UPI001BD989FE|nr:hypothetical protein [Alteromonas oceanisediminis]MBT0586425.1 hypothetical protein [Alteromonas oceanisediminis]